MRFSTGTVVFLLPLAYAGDISIQGFSGDQCDSEFVGQNVHSNPTAPNESSNCIASETFNSLLLIKADAGYQCNVYSDLSCQNFLATLNTAGVCSPVIGQGIICFSQESFDNPLAGLKADVGLGTTAVTIPQLQVPKGFNRIHEAISTACGDKLCDQNAKF